MEEQSDIQPVSFKNLQEPLVHKIESKRQGRKFLALILGGILIVTAGSFTGRWLAKKNLPGVSFPEGGIPKVIKSEKIVGSTDVKSFRDTTEGVLEKGGIDGEGSHHLLREGGPSQTAYLTSSIIDLDQYLGKKVKVWGETFAAQKAGWLMDVGKIEILE